MNITSFYIDGFNLYHAINELEKPHLKWLNLIKLAESYFPSGNPTPNVSYFTAYMHWEQNKSRRHRIYTDALKGTGVNVVESKFVRNPKYCYRYARYCKNYEEKQTDVALALQVVSDVTTKEIEQIYLVTADSDFIPLIEHLRAVSPKTKIIIAAPPGRLQRARELCGLADDKDEIKFGRIGACLLPQNVEDSSGVIVARRPAAYCPPSALITLLILLILLGLTRIRRGVQHPIEYIVSLFVFFGVCHVRKITDGTNL